jgi:hypothetical protein
MEPPMPKNGTKRPNRSTVIAATPTLDPGALLGHTQPGTTQRYANLYDDPLRAATDRVDAIVTGNGHSKVFAEVIELNRR